MKTKYIISVLLILLFQIGFCQTAAKTSESNKRIFKYGLSFGVRTGFCSENSGRAVVTVLPDNNKISIDYENIAALITAASVTVFPFKGDIEGIGFTANITFLEFTSSYSNSIFSKSFEGGIGIAYAIDKKKKFAVAVTYERTSGRKLKDWVINNEGSPIVENSQPITTIDKKDDRYYMNTGLNAVALKFIYHLN